MASEPKNYNSCPLKKRPFLFVDPVKEEPEQEEPVNLCIRKVKDDAAAAVPMQKSSRPQPLKDITAHNHQQQDRIRYAPYRIDESRVPYVKQELYNLLPGYAANTTNTLNYTQRTSLPSPPMPLPPQSASSIKSEPEYWHSSYSREASMSPPSSTRISYVASSPPPIKIAPTVAAATAAAPTSTTHRDQFYQSENVMKSHQYANKASHRYAPYVSRQHHIVDEYHGNSSHMSPTHSHSSLNSLGGSSSSRSSMSPASTSSSIEDPYNMMHVSNVGTTLTKPMAYSESGTGRAEHSVIIKSDMPRYKCADCSKSYSTHSGLTKHMQFHCTASPNNQAPKSFKCQFCDKTYTSLGALKMHIRTHTKVG